MPTTITKIQKQPLTQTQQEYYYNINNFVKRCGLFPTIREIMKDVGCKSYSPIQQALEKLAQKGWIEKITIDGCKSTPRGYRIVPDIEIIPIKSGKDHRGNPLPDGASLVVIDGVNKGYFSAVDSLIGI